MKEKEYSLYEVKIEDIEKLAEIPETKTISKIQLIKDVIGMNDCLELEVINKKDELKDDGFDNEIYTSKNKYGNFLDLTKILQELKKNGEICKECYKNLMKLDQDCLQNMYSTLEKIFRKC